MYADFYFERRAYRNLCPEAIGDYALICFKPFFWLGTAWASRNFLRYYYFSFYAISLIATIYLISDCCLLRD